MEGKFCKDICDDEVYDLMWGSRLFLVLCGERLLLKEEHI
jgi:hypothetical protein